MKTASLAALALLPVLLGARTIVRHDRALEATVELGQGFPATVQCLPDGSGTLIAPRWVLTAAHVARGMSPFSPRVRIAGHAYNVVRVVPHEHPEPPADGKRRRHERIDIALLELAEPSEDVDPAPLYEWDDEASQTAFIAGYGDFGHAGGELAMFDGKRRAVTNTVDSAEKGWLRIDMDRPEEATDLEGVSAPGDSGGSLYLEREGELHLAGVSSASIGDPPQAYGVVDLYVRVSEFLDWIQETQEAAAGSAPPKRDLVDVEESFPDDERGALVSAFFEAYGEDGPEVLSTFEDDFRSKGARRRNPRGAFTRRITARRAELGALEPTLLARVAPSHWAVLARAEKDGGWFALHFRLVDEGGSVALDDLGFRREPAPKGAR